MTLEQQPEPISFAGNLKEFILSSVTANTSFVLKTNGQVIIDEVYAPDADGKITIDLQSVITPMFSLVLPDYFAFGTVQENAVKKFIAKIGTDSYDFTVVRGGVANLNQSTADFLKYNFLTWQPQVKEIFLRQPEFLSYYSAEPSTLKIKAYFEDGTSETHDQILIASKVMTCNMNYDIVNSYFTKQVSYYDAYVANSEGERLTYIQRYVPVSEPDSAQIYLFHNTLAGIDTLICTGTLTQTPSTQSALVTMSQETTDTDTEYEITYEQNTGIIKSASAALWLRDFFVSSYRCHFTADFRRIYIEESENAYTPFEINSYTFEYRYSKQTIYNNVSRNRDSLPRLLEFPTPDKLFFLTPRLSEYPVATYTDDLQIPVQNPYTSAWYRIAAKNLGGGGGQGGGSGEGNFWSKDELTAEELYLLLEGEKIKAGFADDAGKWCGKIFEDYFDQSVRTTDPVQFKTVETESVTTSSFATPDFVSGVGGSGTRLKDDHLELDSITVRKQMIVRELMIEKIKSVGGTLIVSIGAMKITEVTDGGTYFKCVFDNDGGNIDNPFVVDDLVMCQNFSGTNIKRYWRRVTSGGIDYFNLSKTDCEAGSAEPAAGDEIVQLGNRTDASRQSAMILCAVGADAPYIDQYSGINSFTLAGKLITREGNLSGIVDDALGQLSGSGLYAKNAYLRGKLALASGKTVENALGEIDTKTSTAQSTAETAQQAANNAASELSKTNTTLSTVTRDVKLLADAQSGFSVSVSEVREKAEAAQDTIDNLQIGGVNYLNNSRCDTLNGWELSEGVGVVADDEKFGKVVEYTRTVGVGNFQKAFDLNVPELANTELVYFIIAKGIGSWYFGGWVETFTKLYPDTANKIDLGNGWYQYWITFKSGNSVNSYGAFGINSIYGTWRFYAAGVLKGNKPTAWSPSLSDQQAEVQKAKQAAIEAADTASQAKIDLLKTQELALLDGKIDEEEARAIKDAQDKYNAAVAQANKGKLFIRGTGMNNATSRLVYINGTEINQVASGARGLNLTTIKRTDLTVIDKIVYDTCTAGSPAQALTDKLNGLDSSVIVTLTSSDEAASGWTQTLTDAIERCGGSGTKPGYRVPYSFVGIPGIGKGNGIEIITGAGANDPYAEISTQIINGIPSGMSSAANLLSQQSISKLNDWSSDSKISPVEKTALKQQLADIQSEYIDIESSAEKLNKKGGPDWPIYNAAYNAAIAAINKYTAVSPETISVGADYANIAAYYSKRQIMLTTIAYTQTNGKIVKTIDARSLDQNKYYPVVILLSASRRSSIKVEARLHNSGVPAWATHANGFSCDCTWEVSGAGWGTINENRYIHSFTYRFAASTMIGTIGQMTNSSYEHVYVRGGGIYTITATEASLIELKTSDFTVSQQTIHVQTSITEPAVSVDAVRTELTGKIEVLNTSITSLVTKTEYNALGQRVSQAEGNITTLSTRIDLKVSSTDFNALSGRVTTAESSITVLKNRISLLVKTGNIETGLVIKPENIEITGATIFRDSANNQTFSVFGSGGYALNLNNKFKVTTFGKLYATDAEITGKITATSGEFTGTIRSNASGNRIEIDPASRTLKLSNGNNSNVTQFYFNDNEIFLHMTGSGYTGTIGTSYASFSNRAGRSAIIGADGLYITNAPVCFMGLGRVYDTNGWDRVLVNLATGRIAYG